MRIIYFNCPEIPLRSLRLKSVSKSSHLSRHDMTFCPTGENFRSARCARGKKAHFCIFFHRNVTESIPSCRKYHKSGKKCRHLLQPNHPKLVSYVTYLLGPQISSHLSRHDMTCLSGAQISSHLSRFISDKSLPKIESFVQRIVATKRPWATWGPWAWLTI